MDSRNVSPSTHIEYPLRIPDYNPLGLQNYHHHQRYHDTPSTFSSRQVSPNVSPNPSQAPTPRTGRSRCNSVVDPSESLNGYALNVEDACKLSPTEPCSNAIANNIMYGHMPRTPGYHKPPSVQSSDSGYNSRSSQMEHSISDPNSPPLATLPYPNMQRPGIYNSLNVNGTGRISGRSLSCQPNQQINTFAQPQVNRNFSAPLGLKKKNSANLFEINPNSNLHYLKLNPDFSSRGGFKAPGLAASDISKQLVAPLGGTTNFNSEPNVTYDYTPEQINNMPYKCDDCGKRFKQKRYMQTHKNTHKPKEQRKWFACSHPECATKGKNKGPLELTSQRNLLAHWANVHQKQGANIECRFVDHLTNKVCGKKFKYESELKKHERIHTNNCWKCPGCSQEFSHYGNFTKHLKSEIKKCQDVDREKIRTLLKTVPTYFKNKQEPVPMINGPAKLPIPDYDPDRDEKIQGKIRKAAEDNEISQEFSTLSFQGKFERHKHINSPNLSPEEKQKKRQEVKEPLNIRNPLGFARMTFESVPKPLTRVEEEKPKLSTIGYEKQVVLLPDLCNAPPKAVSQLPKGKIAFTKLGKFKVEPSINTRITLQKPETIAYEKPVELIESNDGPKRSKMKITFGTLPSVPMPVSKPVTSEEKEPRKIAQSTRKLERTFSNADSDLGFVDDPNYSTLGADPSLIRFERHAPT